MVRAGPSTRDAGRNQSRGPVPTGSRANTDFPGIVDHFRYPENIFQVQTNMYGRYHLQDATDFYTQAQAWSVSFGR